MCKETLIDWLLFNANSSSISAISWHKHKKHWKAATVIVKVVHLMNYKINLNIQELELILQRLSLNKLRFKKFGKKRIWNKKWNMIEDLERCYWKQLQSNLYIKATQGNLQMWPLWAVALYIHVKIVCTIH
jgi:hypothetical protein